MINKCDAEGQETAGWDMDGKMFVIKNQATFEQQVIPKFFQSNKFSSFTRQLNFYGFSKLVKVSLEKRISCI